MELQEMQIPNSKLEMSPSLNFGLIQAFGIGRNCMCMIGSGEQSVSVLECTGIKEANSRFVFVCPAVVSKLEEALWINNRKYDALWCWEMLKLLVHFALRTRMRQGFQKVLQCFLKAFNEFVQRRVSHYKELNPTENLLLLKAFCELQAQVNP